MSLPLEAIRQCRRCEVPIYFEAEDLTSDDPLLDVQFTAHLAVAEQDNLSRKDNINWGLHAGAELGISKLYNKVCFGYKHDKKGNLVIDEEEANIVRFIFRLYLDGYSVLGIIGKLKTYHIKSPSGMEAWNKHYLEKMLTNVKYAGDVALNIGDKIFIYSDHHPAIISHDSFNTVQEQKKLRSNITENPDGTTTRKPSLHHLLINPCKIPPFQFPAFA